MKIPLFCDVADVRPENSLRKYFKVVTHYFSTDAQILLLEGSRRISGQTKKCDIL
jgi:hypothetical protein